MPSETLKTGQSTIDPQIVQALMMASGEICGNPTNAMVHLTAALYIMHKLHANPGKAATEYLVQQVDLIWRQMDQNSAANVVQGGNG